MQEYEFIEQITACVSKTEANPQFGIGGATQIFVMNPEKLSPVGKPIRLNNRPGGVNLSPHMAAGCIVGTSLNYYVEGSEYKEE